jgi:hypothetical protein
MSMSAAWTSFIQATIVVVVVAAIALVVIYLLT